MYWSENFIQSWDLPNRLKYKIFDPAGLKFYIKNHTAKKVWRGGFDNHNYLTAGLINNFQKQ